MFDPFNIQPSSENTTDYLNCKLQTLRGPSQSSNETVLLLDHNYLLALAAYQSDQISGPSFLVFPDCSFFWGSVNQGVATGICTFYNPRGHLIFCKLSAGKDNIVIFASPEGQSLQAIRL